MGLIALGVAALAAFLLWDTEYQTLKWGVIVAGGLAWYLRRVVASIQKRGGFIREDVSRFWAHAAVIGFWFSIILSVAGIVLALQ
jgi:hypothetical protein